MSDAERHAVGISVAVTEMKERLGALEQDHDE